MKCCLEWAFFPQPLLGGGALRSCGGGVQPPTPSSSPSRRVLQPELRAPPEGPPQGVERPPEGGGAEGEGAEDRPEDLLLQGRPRHRGAEEEGDGRGTSLPVFLRRPCC